MAYMITGVMIKLWRHRKDFLKEIMFALIKMPPQAREVDQHSLGQTLRLSFLSLPS